MIPTTKQPMMWIAYDPMVSDHLKNREQFNGDRPAWGESEDDFAANQSVDVPNVGDMLSLRMGYRKVCGRRLERPELDDDGNRVTGWYWTVLVS